MYLKKLYLIPFIMVLFSLWAVSCDTSDSGSDEDKVEFVDGISVDIRELLGDELLDVIENELNMPIHKGDNPPDIESLLSNVAVMHKKKPGNTISETGLTIIMQPMLLLSTNVPTDEGVVEPGARFSDNYLRFSNQNRENFTIDFDRIDFGDIPFLGSGSFIIGNGNNFSVFGPQESIRENGTVLTVNIFSGTITSQGISSPHLALVMVDNAGLTDEFIPNDTGRSFEDGDGIAPISTWPEDPEETSAGMLRKAAHVINQGN